MNTTINNMPLPTVAELADAILAGQKAWAEDKAGVYTFRGGMKAAKDAGYEAGSVLYGVALFAYLYDLQTDFPQGLPITPEGFVAG